MVCGKIHTPDPQFGCFIIPPNITQKILENGSERQKKDAERTLQSIISIRGRRKHIVTENSIGDKKKLFLI
jgi:hypothetical protein